jgi:surface antigen
MRKFLTTSVLAIPALATVLTLSGCADDGRGGKEVGGTLIGAAAGGLIGSQIGGSGGGAVAGAAIGTLLGAYVGNSIGRQMDAEDRRRMRDAEMRAYNAPLNQRIVWDNPNNGNSGYVTPIREGRRPADNAYCREFQSQVIVGGQRQDAHGTACREPDGSWRIVGG